MQPAKLAAHNQVEATDRAYNGAHDRTEIGFTQPRRGICAVPLKKGESQFAHGADELALHPAVNVRSEEVIRSGCEPHLPLVVAGRR